MVARRQPSHANRSASVSGGSLVRRRRAHHPRHDTRWLTTVVALSVLLTGACSSGGKGQQPTAAEQGPRIPSLRGEATNANPSRAWPRWEDVAVLTGQGSMTTPAVVVRAGSIQWRVRWQCEVGRLVVRVLPPTSKPDALVDGTCPGRGDGFSIETGERVFEVEASGPWQLVVQQQVDTPIDEPPLSEMQAPGARVLATGAFYGLDKTGKGRAVLYRMTDGRLALRFEDFAVPPNSDLFVWTSPIPQPRTSHEAFHGPHRVIAELKSTAGNQNYVLSPGADAADVRSVIIWCEPERFAYAAAALGAPPAPPGVAGE